MRINRFYTTLDLQAGEELLMEESVSHHMIKVLRFRPGFECVLFNGKGGEYSAEFLGAEKKLARVLVKQFDDACRESPLKANLGIVISKGDRMDWVMQKATELGVTSITPLHAEFSDHKLKGDRLEKKMRHWQQVIVSACEQSERTVIPVLNDVLDIKDFAEQASGFKWILHPGKSSADFSSQKITEASLLVGPEGGFSDEDVAIAEQAGFVAASLGPRILRTETAPLVALSLLQNLFGDF